MDHHSSSAISKHKPATNTTQQAPHVEDLLCYLPTYKVLICKDCHFAIQPSALSSHLLRHGFYRGNRKKLTKTLSELTLAEPEDVSHPQVTDEAIAELPVHEGLVCEFDDGGLCGHACMAEKRMAAHWREVHGKHHVVEVRARKARLQTFFRGSKTRYFEVERGVVVKREEGVGERPVLGRGDTAERFYGYGVEGREADAKAEAVEGEGEEKDLLEIGGPLPDLQMLDLGLLHHWHTHTSATISRGKCESTTFWTNTVTSLALECEFLMRSILGMTAVHRAYLGIRSGAPIDQIRRYHNAALGHHYSGLAGFRRALEGGITAENATTFASSARLFGLSFGAGVVADQWLDSHTHPGSVISFFNRSVLGPLEFLLLVRGSGEIQLTAQAAFDADSPFRLPAYILEEFNNPPSPISPSSTSSEFDPRLQALLHATQTLTRPTTDTQALTTALHSLSFCYSGGLPHPAHTVDEHRLWMHGSCWPRLISETYLLLLQAEDPAALVVYAHWCLLVRHLEPFSWYLEGMGERLVEGIRGILGEGEGARVLGETLAKTEAALGSGVG